MSADLTPITETLEHISDRLDKLTPHTPVRYELVNVVDLPKHSFPPVTIWAIVELFGHDQVAGQLTQVEIAGAGYIQIDVPMVDDHPGYRRIVGAGAVFTIWPTDEETVKIAIVEQHRDHAIGNAEGLPAAIRAHHQWRLEAEARSGFRPGPDEEHREDDDDGNPF